MVDEQWQAIYLVRYFLSLSPVAELKSVIGINSSLRAMDSSTTATGNCVNDGHLDYKTLLKRFNGARVVSFKQEKWALSAQGGIRKVR